MLASYAMRGMPGIHSALTATKYGFQDVWFNGRPVTLRRRFGSYVMENVLFKVKYPAEFHGQTAIEAGVALHPQVAHRLNEIKSIDIKTQEPAMRIIDKRGPLKNPADRDHCIQYMTAVALIKGNVTSDDYEDEASLDPRIDALREKMVVSEHPDYSQEYLNAKQRSISNAVKVHFEDGSSTGEVEVRFPIGHRKRRSEALPLLLKKLAANVAATYGEGEYADRVRKLFDELERLDDMPLTDFMNTLSLKGDTRGKK
jgi:2-methylcitrate dehydratase